MTTLRTHHVDPHLFVVLGATSDLMRRKLLPALYRLRVNQTVPAPLIILGVSRQAGLTDEGFRDLAQAALAAEGPGQDTAGHWCRACLYFQSLGAETPEDFRALAARIRDLEQEHQLPGNRVFYLALPPTAFMTSIAGRGRAGYCDQAGVPRGPRPLWSGRTRLCFIGRFVVGS
jgi:glucose-6-phosphate 1-dehydrogenase